MLKSIRFGSNHSVLHLLEKGAAPPARSGGAGASQASSLAQPQPPEACSVRGGTWPQAGAPGGRYPEVSGYRRMPYGKIVQGDWR